ncbi:hypothetical protein GUJ93_ZPchr0005g15975 [Zizania palustris]|uniref:Uncharacterized protein n=1 Tax=Zizania palustris TaxID=103762 RepID=A0A8J5S5I4_ZIZPA|nr:hypothetical protein GUJ93_ZPchr0005g15975 [Zizania palustris]
MKKIGPFDARGSETLGSPSHSPPQLPHSSPFTHRLPRPPPPTLAPAAARVTSRAFTGHTTPPLRQPRDIPLPGRAMPPLHRPRDLPFPGHATPPL